MARREERTDEKQQKPLTLYGIGLINQIMDFTWLFLHRLSATFPFSSSSSLRSILTLLRVATQLSRAADQQPKHPVILSSILIVLSSHRLAA